MNKRYIDFVPARPTVIQPRPVVKVTHTIAKTTDTVPAIAVEQTEIEIIKSQKISDHSLKTPVKPVTTSSSRPVSFERDPLKAEFKAPAAPHFINTDNVAKRPLSKNVYEKPTPTEEAKPSKPVTIIAKPEKDSRAGLVVTIILTIIFGAAVGTVAFLLLPR